MRNYPTIGSFIRVRDGGEIRRVKALWKPRRVLLDDDSIFELSGVEQVSAPKNYRAPIEKDDPEEAFPLPDE